MRCLTALEAPEELLTLPLQPQRQPWKEIVVERRLSLNFSIIVEYLLMGYRRVYLPLPLPVAVLWALLLLLPAVAVLRALPPSPFSVKLLRHELFV